MEKLQTFLKSFKKSSWHPYLAVSLIGKWMLPEKNVFKINKQYDISGVFLISLFYRNVYCCDIRTGLTLRKCGQLFFWYLYCWLWAEFYQLRWRSYVSLIMFCDSYIIQKIRRLLFYFLVYGLFYIKSNVGGRKKTNYFNNFFFLDSRFLMWEDEKNKNKKNFDYLHFSLFITII